MNVIGTRRERPAFAEAALAAAAGTTSEAIDVLCDAVAAHASVRAAALFAFDGEQPRCLGWRRTLPLQLTQLKRALERGAPARNALERRLPFASYTHVFAPIVVSGTVCGAIAVAFRKRSDPALLHAFVPLAATVFERRAKERRDTALRRELRDLRRRQLAHDQHLKELLHRARHDLKAPLVPIKGYVDMMLRGMAGELSPTSRRYLERLRDAVDREASLIDSSLPKRIQPPVSWLNALRQAIASREGTLRLKQLSLEMTGDSSPVQASEHDVSMLSQSLVRSLLAQAPAGCDLTLSLARVSGQCVLSIRCNRPLGPWGRRLAVCEEVLRRSDGWLQFPANPDVVLEATLPEHRLAALRHSGLQAPAAAR